MSDAAEPTERSKAGPSPAAIASRLAAAVLGSYAVAWTYTAFMSAVLIRIGLVRSDAVAWATLSADLVFVGLALLAFAVRSGLKLWLGLAAAAGFMFVGARLLGAA